MTGRLSVDRRRLGLGAVGVLLCATLGLGLLVGSYLGRTKVEASSAVEETRRTAPKPASTSVSNVDRDPPQRACFLGAVVPREEADVAAEIEGLVDSIAVRVGDQVATGDVLAVLDTRSLRHQAAALEADLQAAHAERRIRAAEEEQSAQEHARRSSLGELVSKEEIAAAHGRLQTARAALAVADARVDQVAARFAEVQASLERSTLRAPFPGLVSRRYLDPGARTTAGTPVVHLARLDNPSVRFAVPAELRSQLVAGRELIVDTVDDGRRFRGAVEQIAPEIDPASMLIFVEARLQTETEAPLLFGAEARIRLDDGSSNEASVGASDGEPCSPALGRT